MATVEPTAEQLREAIRKEDETLARVVAFIESGVLAAKISEESGELLATAAGRAHHAVVYPLYRQLSGLLRGEWRA